MLPRRVTVFQRKYVGSNNFRSRGPYASSISEADARTTDSFRLDRIDGRRTDAGSDDVSSRCGEDRSEAGDDEGWC